MRAEECDRRRQRFSLNAEVDSSDHLIFVLLAAVQLFELLQATQAEQSKSRFGDGPRSPHCPLRPALGRPASKTDREAPAWNWYSPPKFVMRKSRLAG